MNTSAVQAAAERIQTAYASGLPCTPVRELIGATDVTSAYAVQEINTARWLEQGRRLVGRKIGLTSKVVQTQLGVGEPDYGMLFADMALADGEELAAGALLQARVEGEVAFCLSRDLLEPQMTIADVIGAVEYAVAAIEIVDSRVAGWDIKIADTVADNASSGRFVLGTEPRRLSEFDPRLCGMVMERHGEQVSLGAGAACLGNPLTALLWLARKVAQVGRPMRAGEIVLSGALGPMVAARPGDVFDLRINRLGSVRAAFAVKG
jgi:2-keto-4-pentenoate hydratase